MLRWLTIGLFCYANAFANNLIQIQGGTYTPLFGKERSVQVPMFYMDEHAVTNQDYADFVKKNPHWRKGKAPAIFVDSDYLKQWSSDQSVGNRALEKSPVVHVSWFSAKAYCESKGEQLPTIAQWEYVSQFGPAHQTKDVESVILEWYSKPTPAVLPHVRSTFKNKFGVWDVHGLIWEWTRDFNTTFVTGESRADASLEKSMFCGSGATGSPNPSDYAGFMRFGFRSSLKGNYTIGNLGFRCVKEKK